jgi:hypothetical protein
MSVVDYEKINKLFKEIDEFLQSDFYKKLKEKYLIEKKLEEDRKRFEEERRRFQEIEKRRIEETEYGKAVSEIPIVIKKIPVKGLKFRYKLSPAVPMGTVKHAHRIADTMRKGYVIRQEERDHHYRTPECDIVPTKHECEFCNGEYCLVHNLFVMSEEKVKKVKGE